MRDSKHSRQTFVDDLITKGIITWIDYSDFADAVVIGRGAFATVSRAYWKSRDMYVALKHLCTAPLTNENEETLSLFVRELKILLQVDSAASNIIQVYGLTKAPFSSDYLIVLQYANGGTLRSYLKEKACELNWTDRLKLAMDVVRAVDYIHRHSVVHRDIHARNILVHDGTALLADFGLSKLTTGQMSSWSTISDAVAVAYIDPQSFDNPHFKRDDPSSDVYSVAVLLWEISSSRQPYEGINIHKLANAIYEGNREHPVKNPPPEYVQLYEQCWRFQSEERPPISAVLEELEKIYLSLR